MLLETDRFINSHPVADRVQIYPAAGLMARAQRCPDEVTSRYLVGDSCVQHERRCSRSLSAP